MNKTDNAADGKQWGGSREGAGRKATGRKKENFYITEEEKNYLKAYLDMIRSGQKPIAPAAVLEEYKKHFEAAVNKQSKPQPSRPQYNLDVYKAQAFGSLIGIPEGQIMYELKGRIEEEAERMRQETFKKHEELIQKRNEKNPCKSN